MFKKIVCLFRTEFAEFYKGHKALIGLSFLYILLRIPSLFEPYWYGDEGVTLTVGMAIRKGYLLYRDIFDNKPPVLYLIASIANGNLYFLKLFSLVLGMGGLWLFFRLSGFVFSTKKPMAIAISNILFVILITTPIFEGNIVNGEITFLVFSLAGYYFTLVKNRYVAAGLLFSMAFLTKVPAIFDLWALVVWILAIAVRNTAPTRWSSLFRLLFAFTVPVLLSILYLTLKGGGTDYLQSVFVQMFGYVSSWGSNTHRLGLTSLLKSGIALKGGLLVATGLIFWLSWQKKKNVSKEQLAVYWLVSAVFGATISGRPYPHYLLQAVPPLCFCLGYIVIAKPINKGLILLSLGLFIFAFKYYGFWQYPNLSYQHNFVALLLRGSVGKDEYYRFFDQSLPEAYKTAGLINTYTKQDDKILVWSNYAQLYPMSQRLPATRYVTAYHVAEKESNNSRYFTDNLDEAKLVVVDRRIEQNKDLIENLSDRYCLAEKLVNYDIYVSKKLSATSNW